MPPQPANQEYSPRLPGGVLTPGCVLAVLADAAMPADPGPDHHQWAPDQTQSPGEWLASVWTEQGVSHGGDGGAGGQRPGERPRHVGGGVVESGETERDGSQDQQKRLLRRREGVQRLVLMLTQTGQDRSAPGTLIRPAWNLRQEHKKVSAAPPGGDEINQASLWFPDRKLTEDDSA